MTLRYEDQISIIDSGKSAEILDLLLSGAGPDQSAEFSLCNYYKEVPISSRGEVLYLFGESLICMASESQSRAICIEKCTIIKSPSLPHDVYAVASYNADSNELSLSGFCYVEVMPDRRTSVRVTPAGLVQVKIEAGTESFSGRLRSISVGGCAVDIDDRKSLGTFRYFFLTGSLFLTGGGEFRIHRLQSKLLRVQDTADGRIRCIFVLEHDLKSEDIVGRYVTQRQAEIIRELKK